MARAINSLPVPVSPWTSTVESVGATNSAFSRTVSRAPLVPMIWSNQLAFASWFSQTECTKAPKRTSASSALELFFYASGLESDPNISNSAS